MLETQNHLQQVNECPLLPSVSNAGGKSRPPDRARENSFPEEPLGWHERLQVYELLVSTLRDLMENRPPYAKLLLAIEKVRPDAALGADLLYFPRTDDDISF